ncbi:MAG: omptin family outer membrane protease [Treponema sp.]|nr:omptin family outer membrane protease [Treponema sp.]
MAVTPLSAETQDFSVSFEARAGMLHGMTQEYVYNGNKQISRLEWEEKTVPYSQAALGFAWKRFFLCGTVKTAVPVKSGLMRNYDYLLPDSNALTHFSQHDAHLDRHNTYDIGIGYGFAVKNWLISPSIGFLYSNRKWTASDGYLRYAPEGTALQGNGQERTVTGAVITYEQKISLLYAAAVARYCLFDRIILGAHFRLYPYVWAESMDHHLLRSTEFFDSMPGGIGGSLGLAIGYKPARLPHLELVAICTFEKLFKTKGGTAQRATGLHTAPSFKPSNTHSSGYDGELWDVFIGVRYAVEF